MTVGDGLVRLRANQIGKQTVFGTAVAATRRLPWKGLVTYDPQRIDPDVDTGSIDPVLKPVPTVPVIGWAPSGPCIYNDQPYRLAAGLKGGVTPTGAVAKTWVYQVASLTADPFEYFTVESGDDQSATDGIQAYGGVADSLAETMPEDLSPWTFSDAWVFGGANLATDRTGALTVDTSPVFVNGDTTQMYLDTAAGSMGITPVVDGLHGATLTISNNLDKKRLANGSNSRKKLAGFARGARTIELALTFAKTALTMSEENTLDDDPVPNRYIRIATTSATIITGTTPYSYVREGAFHLYSVADGEIGGNATKVLTYHAYYDSTLTYAYKATVVNTLSAL